MRAALDPSGCLFVLDRYRGWVRFDVVSCIGHPLKPSTDRLERVRQFKEGWIDKRGRFYAFDDEHSILAISDSPEAVPTIIRIPLPASDLSADGGKVAYAAIYPRVFSLGKSAPQEDPVALIAAIDLLTMRMTRRFASPRRYPGKIIPIIGNGVKLRYDERSKQLWIAWPLEPVLASYDTLGNRTRQIVRPLPFRPKSATERKLSMLDPVPRAQVEQVNYDFAVGPLGEIVVLGPIDHPIAIHADTSSVVRPPLAVDIFDQTNHIRCRVSLPVFGSALNVTSSQTILLTDPEARTFFRIKYSCPSDP